MDSENWFVKKLDELQNDTERFNALTSLNSNLNESPEASIASRILKSEKLLGLYNLTLSNDETSLILEIITKCLSALDINATDNSEILQRYLLNSNVALIKLALTEILKYLNEHPSATLDLNITLAIVNLISHEETLIGEIVSKILCIVLSTIKNDFPIIKEELLKNCEGNAVIKCRVYDLCLNLIKDSPKFLTEFEPILNKMVADLDSDDVILQMAVMDFMSSIAEQNHGYVYLEEKLVFEKICVMFDNVETNPLGSIILPGIMNFFGKIAASQPEKILKQYADLVRYIFYCILCEEDSLLPPALNTLANFASTFEGKTLLDQLYPDLVQKSLSSFSYNLQSLPDKLKICELNALEVIFNAEGEIPDRIQEIARKWYNYIFKTFTFNILFAFCKNPFPDLHIPSLSLVKIICHYKWGPKVVKLTAGFIEFLLNRQTILSENALFLKYDIIKILSESSVFDVQTILELKNYVEKGVVYVEPTVEVAVEGV